MPSIPIDVLREILEHVRRVDLATLCRVSKIFCSCSQDVLYREIDGDNRVIQTLAKSTDLAKRVRSFGANCVCPELAVALRNMSLLRNLDFQRVGDDASILDGCTFMLDSFKTYFPNSKSLQQFLNGQPSLTNLTIWGDYGSLPPFDERSLPNLTHVRARPSWLCTLVPGRPVREVSMLSYTNVDSTDLSFFTLSTTPIQKLYIRYNALYPKPVSLLASIFPSLVHLMVVAYDLESSVRIPLCLSI